MGNDSGVAFGGLLHLGVNPSRYLGLGDAPIACNSQAFLRATKFSHFRFAATSLFFLLFAAVTCPKLLLSLPSQYFLLSLFFIAESEGLRDERGPGGEKNPGGEGLGDEEGLKGGEDPESAAVTRNALPLTNTRLLCVALGVAPRVRNQIRA